MRKLQKQDGIATVDVAPLTEILVLTDADTLELVRCEHAIQSGLETVFEVGEALTKIRDGRLYRGTHKTFEGYCREKWSIGKSHAYRLIDSAEVVADLSPIGDVPKSEYQVRRLIQSPKELRPAIWEKAQAIAKDTGAKEPTAKHIEVAAEELDPSGPFRRRCIALEHRREAKKNARRVAKVQDREERVPRMLCEWGKCNQQQKAEFLAKAGLQEARR